MSIQISGCSGGNIIRDATATIGDVLQGKTFYNNYGKQTGALRVTSIAYDYELSNLIAFDSSIRDDYRETARYVCTFNDKLYIFWAHYNDGYDDIWAYLIYDIPKKNHGLLKRLIEITSLHHNQLL